MRPALSRFRAVGAGEEGDGLGDGLAGMAGGGGEAVLELEVAAGIGGGDDRGGGPPEDRQQKGAATVWGYPKEHRRTRAYRSARPGWPGRRAANGYGRVLRTACGAAARLRGACRPLYA